MLLQKMLQGAQQGATLVMYLLIALSVISVGIVLERWWYFRRRRFDLEKTCKNLTAPLRARDVEGARKVLGDSRAVEADIMRDGLSWFEAGPDSVREIMQKGVRERRKNFEGGLIFLGTLGSNSPFVGLFGTVLGVVAAFRELGNAQSSMAGGGGGMGNVMGAIGEALIATAIGILVAMPAVVAYNIFQKKGADIEENTAALGNLMIAAMEARPAETNKKGAKRLIDAEEGKVTRRNPEVDVEEAKPARRNSEVEA